ncbi:hypothetical protein KA977_13805, partial [Candidatus Dependentiae bacterium]|nr:hypothetical protein [Candidatus Dependentiae bacterium]
MIFFSETLKAKSNFINSGESLSDEIIIGMLEIKKAAASANFDAGILSFKKKKSIIESVEYLLDNPESRKKYC